MVPAGALQHVSAGAPGLRSVTSARTVIQRETQALGFLAVAFTPATPLIEDGVRLQHWLERGYHGTMSYLAAGPRDVPRKLLPGCRTIVSVAFPCAQGPTPDQALPAPAGRMARYAHGDDYHLAMKERLRSLADRLAHHLSCSVLARACVDTAPLLERAVAERAGLGFVGKNTLLIVPGRGSFLLLGELLVDLELAPGEPLRKRCGACTRCLDECPTQAFVGPYVLDARRCISYLTIEHKGAIPRELRSKLSDWVFGCDLCQTTCPFNHGSAASPAALGSPPVETLPPLDVLLNLGSSAYKRLVKNKALARVSRAQLARNAAVALGNQGSLTAVPALCRAVETHSSGLVRGHAAWALGALRAMDAKALLRRTAAEDPDPEVRHECCLALNDLEA